MELSDLTTKRCKHVESCTDNNDKSHEIIADLYSDPSHFIYEILQNADDAGASEVKFSLKSNSLSIAHNGKKLFSFDDVDSITTVGSSTKKDDVNSIGTFGAGFKSVFAITKTPHIHSGNYNFKITDFIVPKEIEYLKSRQNATAIILPFDHPDISADNAYKQISNRLQALESESLLFLRNIKEIQWETESDSGHYLSEINGNQASLISQVNEKDSLIEYFLCTKNIEVDNTTLNIVVAYSLDKNGAIDSDSVHDSKLFVFFPTNERTGFKFLVHAPYKTTPSRESIPFDDNQNKLITKELSCLIAESIIGLKSSGLLNVKALSMLPIDSKNEHPLYRSAFHQVKSIFTSDPLLPSTSGGYECAGNTILARERELSNLLEKADCSKLFNRESWLSTDITYDKTRALRDYLTGELEIPEITMQKFCSEITEEFIKAKPDDWVVNFYSSITKNKALYRVALYRVGATSYQTKGVLRERPIIRLEDGSHVCPENDLGDIQVYLPSTGQSRFKTVKRSLLASDESFEFLRSLGLKEPDNIAEITEFIIPKYQGNYIKKDEYADDFERVLAIWLQVNKYEKKEIADLLRQSLFIRCQDQNGASKYQTPNNVYFHTEKLSSWFKNNTGDKIYFLESSVNLSEDGRKFLESLGVRYNLRMFGTEEVVVNSHGWHERSVNDFNPKYNIHGLEFALKNITIERSVLLWRLLLKNTNKLKGYIETRSNQSHPYNRGEEKISKAMSSLDKCWWLYDGEQKIIASPINQITLDDISNEYQKEDENIERLIKALGLKLDEIKEFEEKTGKKVISPEDYELLQKIKDEQHDSEKDQKQEDSWSPEAEPDDVTPIVDEADLEERKSEDLSGQTTTEEINQGSTEENDGSEDNTNNSMTSRDRKAIGDWGESIANRHLEEKYPSNDVVWLNKSGNIGRGYDFVIRNNGEDIAYYEIKSKTDESPKLFQVSGTQWNWAKQLHNSKKGDMYKILLISNAGTEQPKIREIENPVELWKSGKLYADPVNIDL